MSEASAFRILTFSHLITGPAYAVRAATDEFRGKTERPNQHRQGDFTDLKTIGWGWLGAWIGGIEANRPARRDQFHLYTVARLFSRKGRA
ncbi:hypothetical protein [Pelagimonas sp.]|uniref:hypothetical protein n=1 Tax=Pelagimonas sp. TaxID=2073170 RepID=UPI003D6A5293